MFCSFKLFMFNRRTPGLAEGDRPAAGCQELFSFVFHSHFTILIFSPCSFKAINLPLKSCCLYPHLLICSFSLISSKYFPNSSMISYLTMNINYFICRVSLSYLKLSRFIFSMLQSENMDDVAIIL